MPDVDGLRQRILQEAHNAPYSFHPGVTKMYQDVKGMYWWNGMKKDVAQYVASCLTCQQVKFEHQRPQVFCRSYHYLNGNGRELLWISWFDYQRLRRGMIRFGL